MFFVAKKIVKTSIEKVFLGRLGKSRTLPQAKNH